METRAYYLEEPATLSVKEAEEKVNVLLDEIYCDALGANEFDRLMDKDAKI